MFVYVNRNQGLIPSHMFLLNGHVGSETFMNSELSVSQNCYFITSVTVYVFWRSQIQNQEEEKFPWLDFFQPALQEVHIFLSAALWDIIGGSQFFLQDYR